MATEEPLRQRAPVHLINDPRAAHPGHHHVDQIAPIAAHVEPRVHMNTSFDMRGYWRDLVYVMVARMCGTRIVYQVHWGALPQRLFGRHPILTEFLRLRLRLPDVIVVLARMELEAYRAFVPRQHVVALPNSVDCASFAGLPSRRSDPNAPLRLVYVGRLAREKGLYDLLRALLLARAGGIDAHLTVV